MVIVQTEYTGSRRSMRTLEITESRRQQELCDEFVDEMSNWYVRRSRDRFWAKGMEQDKINAYMTLVYRTW